MDANTFFNNREGVPRPPYHQNQYGITSGGPVWIPKVFNGKNKVFWFFGWEGMRDSDPADSPLETGNPEDYTSVPTAAERRGDFSQFLGLASNATTIYDPNSGTLAGTQVCAHSVSGQHHSDANRLNPIALAYPNYFPQPNNTTSFANGNQNYRILGNG